MRTHETLSAIKKAAFGLALVVFSIFACETASAQADMHKMKSIFIYNFTKYINWENVGNEFVIGVFSDAAAFKAVEATFRNRNVAGVPVRVVQLKNPAEASGCQLVYLTQGSGRHAASIAARNRLVVSDDDIAGKGSMISFHIKNSKLTFKISPTSCTSNGLQVSSQLLAMGIEV